MIPIRKTSTKFYYKEIVMKGYISVAVSSIIFFAGCAVKPEVMEKEAIKKLKKEEIYKTYLKTRHNKEQTVKNIALSKHIKAYFYDKPVYEAIKEISFTYDIPFDRSFVPSRSDYRITINFDGTLKDFLDQVYRDTGVKYDYVRNMLQVVNPELVVEDIIKKECNPENRIVIKLKRSTPNDILSYFANKYGYNFTTNFKFDGKSILSGAPSVANRGPKGQNVDSYNDMFSYVGCDPEEALFMYLKTKNLTAKKIRNGFYEIRDFEEVAFSYPMFFNQYQFQSGGNLGSNEQTNTQNFKSLAGENFFKTAEALIREHISQVGRYSFSNRGLVSIIDYPNNIEEIKKLFNKEIAKQHPFKLRVSIVRIDKGDSVDSETMVKKILSNIGVNMPFLNDQTQGITVFNADNPNIALKALEESLDAKIVRDYVTTTRAGKITSFKAVDVIPYVTGSLIINQGTATNTAEGKFAEAGLILNILPTIKRKTNTLDYSIDIVVSEYLGDKTITFQGGSYTLPRFNSNEVQTEAVSHLGETIILTGFRLKNWENREKGLPGFSQNDIAGWLFGGRTNKSKYSDFVIFISSEPLN